MKKINIAFTLIELIVSITILAILGTIAFISLQSYSQNSRDSLRVSDISTMKTGLELFYINSGNYPLTTNGYDITYSGGVIWSQGIFGKDTLKNVNKLNILPIDPLTGKEYTYSLLSNRQEYELAGIIESSVLTLTIDSTNVYASIQDAVAIVSGNYNGETIKISNLGETCIIALPSLITSSGTTLNSIMGNNLFVYNNYKNLPSNYKGYNKSILLGEENLNLINNNNKELYCGNLNDLLTNENKRIAFIENFKNAYLNTKINKSPLLKKVLDADISNLNPQPYIKSLSIKVVEAKLKKQISKKQKLEANLCSVGNHFEGTICISNTRTVAITNGTGTQTWNGSNWATTTLTSCNIDYHTEDNTTCISNTRIVAITNGTGTQTWSLISWGTNITVVSCNIDYYNSGDNRCSTVGNGFYSNNISTTKNTCTNLPGNNSSRNYYYTSSGNGTSSCTYSYSASCGIDNYESSNGVCSYVGTGRYSPNNNNGLYSCSNKVSSTYYFYTSAGNGSNSCGYTHSFPTRTYTMNNTTAEGSTISRSVSAYSSNGTWYTKSYCSATIVNVGPYSCDSGYGASTSNSCSAGAGTGCYNIRGYVDNSTSSTPSLRVIGGLANKTGGSSPW